MNWTKKSVTFTGATTDGEILDPTTGTRFVLHELLISVTGTAEVTIYDETDAAGTQILDQRVTDAWHMKWPRNNVPWSNKRDDGLMRSAAINNKLEITYSETINAFVTIYYTEEAV